MRGRYGVPMNALEHKPKMRWCKQCEHCGAISKKSKRYIFCKARQKSVDRTKPHLCKAFKKKWQDAKGGEVVTYYNGEV